MIRFRSYTAGLALQGYPHSSMKCLLQIIMSYPDIKYSQTHRIKKDRLLGGKLLQPAAVYNVRYRESIGFLQAVMKVELPGIVPLNRRIAAMTPPEDAPARIAS